MKNGLAKHILITGGAGFIGTNAAFQFSRDGWQVTILDNFSRRGSEHNVEWLRRRRNVAVIRADVRDVRAVESAVNDCRHLDAVLHLAAQVAVTTSVVDPRTDFEVNALGTLNILEAVRKFAPDATFIFSSTNKVYGALEDVATTLDETRYRYTEMAFGIDEHFPLAFYSPYGCSKGASDQYVLDYAHIYGLRATSFRQSCIYGPHQFGIEDQGWVAWFIIAALLDRPIVIYGNGKQVRDVLHVDDLIRAFAAAIAQPDRVLGEAFNIGGGPDNTLSLLELVGFLEGELKRPVRYSFADWRPGDQRVYISNIGKARTQLGWEPKVSPSTGMAQLVSWVSENAETIRAILR